MSSSSSNSASATSKLTPASSASASSTLTTVSAASASSTLTASSPASAMCMRTATPTLKRTASNTSLDSVSSQDPAKPAVHKRIHLDELSDEASSSSDSGESDDESDDDYQEEEEEEEAVWAMMVPNVWDALSGAYSKKTIAWNNEMDDVVEVFGTLLEEEY
ncbi:predicted protein [Lichtheimia corymbifera JMRC:FSU:9682]|uniref:Uncharacterized protein n=1 Tax=Lichtheimia corymbifera JMRC:FSU:9682 TaxID=1263082 RepID=A0A068SD31_9FUNG|nr:predicted protein [Lichtheimia corymbifera JMRC:FSU:9682]